MLLYARKMRRKARQMTFATGRRAQRLRKPSAKVGEAYCPVRLTGVAEEHGLEATFALDLTTVNPATGEPWDFNLEANQQAALESIEKEDPGVVLVSPTCAPVASALHDYRPCPSSNGYAGMKKATPHS